MYRHLSKPRTNWEETVKSQGLVFPVTDLPDGGTTPYWNESAFYELSLAEVETLENTTEELHRMCVEAAKFLAEGHMGQLGLTAGALELAKANLESNPPSLYGRFDLVFDGTGPAKMLEYNADTPTGLVESAVAQWHWLQDVMPNTDQWNSVHDRLVRQWQNLTPLLPSRTVHFAHHDGDYSGEEWMTVAYLRDTADQAGLSTVGLTMEDIGYNAGLGGFVDLNDLPIRACFKLSPWEDMLAAGFGKYVFDSPDAVTWLEPLWKVLLSNKTLLAALWHLYPGHENLLPSYLGEPGPLTEWVAKPLHGREGDGIQIHSDLVQHTPKPSHYGPEGHVYQQWCPLPDFDGNKAVIGSWVIDGKAAGAGIRESDGYVTDYYARFVPHIVSEPAPDEKQVDAWLNE